MNDDNLVCKVWCMHGATTDHIHTYRAATSGFWRE